MLVVTLLLPSLISITFGGYFLYKASRRGPVLKFEFIVLLAPILIWNYLLLLQIGSQSISNVVEVYVVAGTLILYSVFRCFKVQLSYFKVLLNMGILLVEPLLLRIFFPSIVE